MRRYPEEVHQFIVQNIRGMTTRDLVELVNARFGLNFTDKKMYSYKKNHNLKSGTPHGVPAGRPTKLYPAEIRKFINENHVGIGPKEMTELLNKTFGTSYTAEHTKAYYARQKIKCGLTGHFQKGRVPFNKGLKGICSPGSEKGWFRVGHINANHRPVGSERVDNKDGYTMVKIAEPNVWELKHKVIWEEKNGKVPDGHILTFLDGNKENITLDNLALITMAESLVMTRSKLRSSEAEFTKTGLLIARVKIAQRKRKKSLKNG